LPLADSSEPSGIQVKNSFPSGSRTAILPARDGIDHPHPESRRVALGVADRPTARHLEERAPDIARDHRRGPVRQLGPPQGGRRAQHEDEHGVGVEQV
jgi:hypothetical protein